MRSRQPSDRVRLEPLWVRVERNRLRQRLFLVGFAIAASVLFAFVLLTIPTLPIGLLHLMIQFTSLYPEGIPLYARTSAYFAALPSIAAWVWAASLAAAALYEWRVLSYPVELQLVSSGATLVSLGELMETKSAMKDMALASGVNPAPALYVLPSRSVNAMLVARGSQRPVCAVTEGLVDKLDTEEQRAVFANLIARLVAGQIAWASTVSALMAPLLRWRAASLSGDGSLTADAIHFIAGDRRTRSHSASYDEEWSRLQVGLLTLAFAAWAWVAYIVAVLASELVAIGQRRTHLVSAEAGDAEGMLLLKDPAAMLRALRRTIDLDNRVRMAMPVYSGLFYIWAGDDLADDDDPEWRRLDRLRQVVGIDGVEDAVAEARESREAAEALAGVVAPEPPALEMRHGEREDAST